MHHLKAGCLDLAQQGALDVGHDEARFLDAAVCVGSKNSPFMQALLEHINDPKDIAVVLRKVREKVMKAAGGKQQPWEYGSLTG